MVILILLTVLTGIGFVALLYNYIILRRSVLFCAAQLELSQVSNISGIRLISRSAEMLALAAQIDALLERCHNLKSDQMTFRHRLDEDLACLSHDIRTPLAGAQGYLELYDLDKNSDNRARYVACSQERLAHMRTLVDDLLESTKAAAAHHVSVVDRISIYPIVTSSALRFYPSFSDRGWTPFFDLSRQATILTNPESFERICDNLFSNALRYGNSAPTVELHNGHLIFSNSVNDPASIDVSRLFEMFYQADAACTNGGSGLGLAIVARLCSDMDARVEARLNGSTLSIDIDLTHAGFQMEPTVTRFTGASG